MTHTLGQQRARTQWYEVVLSPWSKLPKRAQ
jgi:hypothetical protein